MTATTIAAPPVRRRSAMTQLIITELKLFVRGRAAVGLLLAAGFPLLLLVIFGAIHSFNTPVAKFGGLTKPPSASRAIIALAAQNPIDLLRHRCSFPILSIALQMAMRLSPIPTS